MNGESKTKRFFYASLGTLCLAAAYSLGTIGCSGNDQEGSPTGIETDAPDVSCVVLGDGGIFFGSDGRAYELSSNSWGRSSGLDLPVAVEEVANLSIRRDSFYILSLVTHSGVGWHWSHRTDSAWKRIGVFPGCPGDSL